MELNVQNWKEFTVGRILNCNTTVLSIKDILDDGNIPFVSRTAENNGIDGYVSVEQSAITKGNCLTVGAEGIYSFYQQKDFATGNKVYTLRNDNISIYHYMFIATILNKEDYKYSYGRARIKSKLEEEIIKLPIKYNNDNTPVIDENRTYSEEGYIPDWQFMEDYIKSLHHRPITTKVKSGNIKKLDVDNWEEFKVQDLFELVHGKANDGMLEEGNDCVYLGAKLNDCGFMRKCKYNEKLAHEGNCICFVTNGEGSVGYAFYKGLEDKFIATIDLVMGYADFLTPAIGSFIATCLCLERRKYSHGRKWKKTLPTTVIKLPIQRDSNGNPVIDDNRTYSDNGYIPDWQFMEDYINSLPYSDRI